MEPILKKSIEARPPVRCDIRPEDLSTLADVQRNTRRLALQYSSNPLVCRNLTGLRDFLLEQFPATTEAIAQESDPTPESAPEPTEKHRGRRCLICCDARRKEIEAALGRGISFRLVARQFQLSKSAVARHSRHRS